MQEVRFYKTGGPEVLRLQESAQPIPRGGELLVRAHATSVNHVDVSLRAGEIKLMTAVRLPMVPGFDVAGEVAAVGPSVSAFTEGERVFGFTGIAAGACAEYVILHQASAARAPQSISLTHAAAVPLAALTALQALRTKARVKRDTRVLIFGASGGVGSFAVQLAKFFGCRTSAAASAPKLEYVRGLGADELLDYKEPVFGSPTAKWDVIIDAWGRLDYRAARSALVEDGVFVATRPELKGTALGYAEKLLPPVFRTDRQRYEMMLTSANSHDLVFLAHLIDTGRLQIPVDRTFPLTALAEAHTYFESGAVRGKVLIENLSPGQA